MPEARSPCYPPKVVMDTPGLPRLLGCRLELVQTAWLQNHQLGIALWSAETEIKWKRLLAMQWGTCSDKRCLRGFSSFCLLGDYTPLLSGGGMGEMT